MAMTDISSPDTLDIVGWCTSTTRLAVPTAPDSTPLGAIYRSTNSVANDTHLHGQSSTVQVLAGSNRREGRKGLVISAA